MSIEIFLDNSNNAYFPGQTISGRIECTFYKKKNLRAIKIRFWGRSNTSWIESESYYDSSTKEDKTRSVQYSAEETYMDTQYNLVQGDENFNLPAGKHVYSFSYILPTQLPSSFEGTEGYIRYNVEAVVDRPWKFNYKANVLLNVTSPIDLNVIPGLRDPVAISDDKTMCSCWCNDSGALTFNLSIPVTGYVPGQEITIGSYVRNMTNVSATSVKFEVVAKYEYITHYPDTHTRCNSNKLVTCVEGGVGAHSEKSWTSTVLIPTNRIYPNLTPCSIINVHYKLKAEVVVPCPHTNLKLEFPITIGSVPLSGVSTAILGPPLPDGQVSLLDLNVPVINSELPPPYQEKDSGGLPPPYPSRGGEGGSAPYASIGGHLPCPLEGTASYSGVVPSYLAAYPPVNGSTSSCPPQRAVWSEPNAKDTTASAPPYDSTTR